jgi:hypothetical protein
VVNPCQLGGAASAGARLIGGAQAAGNLANGIEHLENGDYLDAMDDFLGAQQSLAKIRGPCFAAGTPLLTPAGHKAIEQFKPGDLILSAPEDDPDAPLEAKQVEELFTGYASLFELAINGRLIRTTAQHPFFVRHKGWTEAGQLIEGDWLRSHDGRWVRVQRVHDTAQDAAVYNVRIDDYHTYFVGAIDWGFSVWAHNACSSTSGETAAAARGRREHQQYNPGPGYDTRVVLPSGKKPDAVDFERQIVRELKPNNPRALAKGQSQVQQYARELQETYGGTWRTFVDKY